MITTAGFGFTQIAVSCAQQTVNPITGAVYTCPWAGQVNPFDSVVMQTVLNGTPTGVTVSVVCPGCNQPITNKPALTFSLAQIQALHSQGKLCPQAYTPVMRATLSGQIFLNGATP